MKTKRRHRRKDTKRKPWSKKEDEAVKVLVRSIGTKQWTLVAEQLHSQFNIPGRTGKQCRERWHNHLGTGISKDPWSAEEEHELFRLQSFIGNKWAEISNSIAGRTDNSVKNHFYSTLRKQYRKVHGVDPTREQLQQEQKTLAGEVLSLLSQKAGSECKENLFAGLESPCGLPAFDEKELVVIGQQISFPAPSFFLVDEGPLGFWWEDRDFFGSEMMPLSQIEDFEE